MPILLTILVSVFGLAVVGSILYLLTLLGAASLALRTPMAVEPSPTDVPFRINVVIPAHNEELVLAETLRSLKEQTYPQELFRVVVVADNCTDTTAEIARCEGVTVMERSNLVERGKGYALEWAFSILLAGSEPADAYVIVDADTWTAPNFLTLMASSLSTRADANGCCALQGRYGVLNPQQGWRAALMAGAFDLFNHVRPLGANRLGLSVGLKGNGMAFTRPVLEKARWQGRSITEDIDYGLDLLQYHQIRVGYHPAARVLAQMPTTAAAACTQRDRWEGGRYRLLRERFPGLFVEGIRQSSVPLCFAALDLLLPPLAELAGIWLVWALLVALGVGLHWLPAPAWWAGAVILSLLGLASYIIGGLRAAGAPAEAYAALLKAPFYVAWKFGLYAVKPFRSRKGHGSGESAWVRTERAPMESTPSSDSPTKKCPPEEPAA